MKKLATPLLVFCCFLANGQTILFSEDFAGEADGATAGTAVGGTWSATTIPAGTFSKQTRLGEPLFMMNQTVTEGVFATNTIDISGTGMAQISVFLRTALSNSTDYMRAYYKVDGGPEILFHEFLGQFISLTIEASAVVAGNNVQVIIRGMENTAGNIPILGIPIAMSFDNLSVTSVPSVFSCNNAGTVFTGDWNVAASWSTVGFTGPCDAPTPPTIAQVAIIGGSFAVNLTADAAVGGVDVRNTGTLLWTAGLVDLGIEMGFFRVQSGGVIDGDNFLDGQIDFTQDVGGATFQVDVGGSASIDAITLTNTANTIHYLEGGGPLTIGQILMDADDGTLINNMTLPVVTSGHLLFTAATTGATFINNETLIMPALEFTGDNNFFTNNSTASFATGILASNANSDNNTVTNAVGATLNFSDLNADFSGVSLDGGNITILNSGTINQTGTFLRIANSATALNDVNNLAGAIWNYEGTGHDTQLRLFANNGTNDFNYSAAGPQQIITPVSGNGYSNLTLEDSGTKTALAVFNVYGNWSRTGTATFDPAGFTVTLTGTAGSQTIAAVGGETFAGLRFNNLFATAPQIIFNSPVTVTGTLTMTSGIVNQNGNAFTLGSAGVASVLSRTASTTTNWMYGGSFQRFWLNGVAVSSTAGNRYGLFPAGTSAASSYRPFEVNSTVSPTANGSYTVTHTDATGVVNLSPVFDDDPTAGVINIVRKHNAQFIASVSGATGGTFTVRATMTGLLAGNLGDIRLAVSTGPTTVTTVGTHSAATGSAPNPSAGRTGVLTANLTGDFRIATTDAVNTPLPIELISFSGEVVENVVQLNWETASELNNDFFTVERSAGGEVFSSVGIVKGAGITTESKRYDLIDHDPIVGKAYYRLRQTDFDGTYTYSKIIPINYEVSPFPAVDVYPNPSHGEFTVRITGLKNEESIPLMMVDPLGRAVMTFTLNVDHDSGTAQKTIHTDRELPPGIYLLKAGASRGITRKVVVTER